MIFLCSFIQALPSNPLLALLGQTGGRFAAMGILIFYVAP